MLKKTRYSIFGVVILAIYIVSILVHANTSQAPIVRVPIQPATVKTAPPYAPAVLDRQKIKTILTDSTTHYSALLNKGKEILGTTQYLNATAGLHAMDDQNSSAVRFGAFRTDTCVKNDVGTNALSTYNQVSDMYSAVGTDSPEALGNWNYDINTAASDLCLWAGDAVSWEIREISTTKLEADEQKVRHDLELTQGDIDQLLK